MSWHSSGGPPLLVISEVQLPAELWEWHSGQLHTCNHLEETHGYIYGVGLWFVNWDHALS